MTKKILITGASGLVGGILIQHLSKNSNYDIYGIDRHVALSIRYQLENTPLSKDLQPILPMKEKFFICDILDKDELSRIIRDNKIQIIIHLAAVLEMETVEQIERINCNGTRIIFDIAREQNLVEMVIYGSSAMTVFGYFENKPYLSLAKNIQPQQPLTKITTNGPPIPSHFNPSFEAYCKSKIYGEELARRYSSINGNKVKFICLRFGYINTTDDVTSNVHNWSIKANWCSYRDLCQFIERILENQLKLKQFHIYFVMSNNDFCWADMENSREDLNYVSIDGIKWS
ncbi:unnamed protein product [Rotaria sordida]|uniref:NAD-dependent epimerase/dehydratase domain-containing protein n=2 Tax=Rotaria sordida TaxID=392033 RepID=A0A819ECD6_9BILA|nr:unnamed protein product [Rotaria sordida]